MGKPSTTEQTNGRDVAAILEGYDWEETFAYAGKRVSLQGATSPPDGVPPGSSVSEEPFDREDVSTIFHIEEGEHDGPEWIVSGLLTDGRHFFLAAGCDYTGWDCQAGGRAWVANTREEIERFGMDDRTRERFGIVLQEI